MLRHGSRYFLESRDPATELRNLMNYHLHTHVHVMLGPGLHIAWSNREVTRRLAKLQGFVAKLALFTVNFALALRSALL